MTATENTGYAAYTLFNSLKLHFTSDYDFVKYGGKTTATQESFLRRPDKYFFYRMSRKYNYDELKLYYIANLLENPNIMPGPLGKEMGESNYKKWQKRNQSLTYRFEQDIIYLLDKYGNQREEIFRVDNGNYPKLLEEVMHDNVTIETLIILNNNTGFLEQHWVPRIKDDVLWPNWLMKIKKYSPFVMYNREKCKSILKERIKEYA